MQSYDVTTPRYPRLKMRLLAYAPSGRYPSTDLKVTLQATDEEGHPIAEDPLASEFMTPYIFSSWLDAQRSDGWVIEPAETKYQRQWRS